MPFRKYIEKKYGENTYRDEVFTNYPFYVESGWIKPLLPLVPVSKPARERATPTKPAQITQDTNINPYNPVFVINGAEQKKKPYDVRINNRKKQPTVKPNIKYSHKQAFRRYKTNIEPRLQDKIKVDEEDDLVSKIQQAFGIKRKEKENGGLNYSGAGYSFINGTAGGDGGAGGSKFLALPPPPNDGAGDGGAGGGNADGGSADGGYDDFGDMRDVLNMNRMDDIDDIDADDYAEITDQQQEEKYDKNEYEEVKSQILLGIEAVSNTYVSLDDLELSLKGVRTNQQLKNFALKHDEIFNLLYRFEKMLMDTINKRLTQSVKPKETELQQVGSMPPTEGMAKKGPGRPRKQK